MAYTPGTKMPEQTHRLGRGPRGAGAVPGEGSDEVARTNSSTASATAPALPPAGCGRPAGSDRRSTRPVKRLSLSRHMLGHDAIGRAVQHDGRHRDRRLCRELALDRLQRRDRPARCAKRWRYDWIVTSTKSGLSKDGAERSKVASSNVQFGDHSRHSNLMISRRLRLQSRRARARCGNSIDTRSDAPARLAPARSPWRCPGCCSRCR